MLSFGPQTTSGLEPALGQQGGSQLREQKFLTLGCVAGHSLVFVALFEWHFPVTYVE